MFLCRFELITGEPLDFVSVFADMFAIFFGMYELSAIVFEIFGLLNGGMFMALLLVVCICGTEYHDKPDIDDCKG